jgi:hypothetical protein
MCGALHRAAPAHGIYMHKLRGSGNTFSTSGREWLPFRMNPKVGRRAARLHRLLKNQTIQPLSKDELRSMADKVAQGVRVFSKP